MHQELSVFNLMADLVVRLLGMFFFQAEDGIRDLVRSRGLGDVYKRQAQLAMVALLGLFKLPQMMIELRLGGERHAIDALQLSLIHI